MYKIGETDLTFSLGDQENWGWERTERLLVFELTDDEHEEYKKLSPIEIMEDLEERGFRNESDYFVQPGAQYTDYEFVACVSHGFGGQLIIREITSYNI